MLTKLLSMIKFSHTVFALPFALLAALMAWVVPTLHHPVSFQWQHLAGILICMVGARSAAMAFNRLADRKIDAGNPRTAGRHLPSGELSVGSVTAFTIASIVIFLAGNLLFLPNWLPLALSIPVLGVLLGYTYTKRFTSLAHFWLGLALSLAPVCVWIAIRGLEVIANPSDITPAIVLGVAILFWVAGFDIIYACQDYAFDKASGLHSIPVRLGVAGALRLAAACHAIMIVLLAIMPLTHLIIGPPSELGVWWWIGVAVVAGLLIYEHAIVRADDLTRVNVAFFNINAVVSIGLLIVAAFDLLS